MCYGLGLCCLRFLIGWLFWCDAARSAALEAPLGIAHTRFLIFTLTLMFGGSWCVAVLSPVESFLTSHPRFHDRE